MTSAPTTEHSTHQHVDALSASTVNRKTLLFCPCGREAPPANWRTERHGDHRRLVCPDCAATLTVR